MIRSRLHSCIAVLLVCLLPSYMIGSTVLGTVVSDGDFRLNSSLVTGSATLFDGSAVETNQATSRIQLDGAWMLLDSNSRARVKSSQVTLERGIGEIGTTRSFALDARSLKIVTEGAGAAARVKLDGRDNVVVGALRGSVKVLNSNGILIASLRPGTTLSFLPKAAAADISEISGCLVWKEGKYIVVDSNGQATIVEGTGLDKLSGNPVKVTGTATGKPTDALPTVKIATITQTGDRGCLAAATSQNAQLTPPADAPAGPPPSSGPATMAAEGGKSTKLLVIAGVGVAAAVGIGVAAASGKKGTS